MIQNKQTFTDVVRKISFVEGPWIFVSFFSEWPRGVSRERDRCESQLGRRGVAVCVSSEGEEEGWWEERARTSTYGKVRENGRKAQSNLHLQRKTVMGFPA